MKRAHPGPEIGPLPTWLHEASVEFGAVPASLPGETASGAVWRAAPGRFLLEVPGLARYLVRDGQSITIDPHPSASDEDVARFARATPFAALCHQRGIPVLHAAAAARGDRAVLVAGDSAAGKSTLLAALLARGWRMLTDDLAPVTLDEELLPVVLPSFPELILWQDALEQLGTATSAQARLPSPIRSRPQGSWSLPTGALMVPAPVRVGTVWRLSTHNRGRVEVETIDGVGGFALLGGIAYNSRIAAALLDPRARLRVDSAIVAHCDLGSLKRPRGRWSVGELAERLAERDSLEPSGVSSEVERDEARR